jgi:muconate cycloisomerase
MRVTRDFATSLRNERVDAIPVELPLKKSGVMAGERIDRSRNLLVRIEASNGLVGWGEASEAPLMTGDTLPGMVAAINTRLARLLIGEDALRRAELARRCAHAIVGNTGAKCALDMALNDLVGHALGVSLADLFGGPLRDQVAPMYLLGNASAQDDIDEARREVAAGWRFLKLKVGIKPPLEEAAAAVEVRRCIGNDVALCADANTGMTMSSAKLFAECAREANLLFLEQPLAGGDFEGMAALARVSAIPLNGDESIGSVADIVMLQRMGAIQGANLKTIKFGGVTAVAHAMSVCGSLGLNINLACKVAESSIASAALVQLACIAPNLHWGVNVTQHYLAEDVCDVPLRVHEGIVRRPTGPGLGIAVSEARVSRFRVQ